MSSSPIITRLLAKAQRTDLPNFAVGDTVKVHVKIKEGDKERIQVFEGVVLKKRAAQLYRPQDELRAGRRACLPAGKPDHREN
jgi:ribosomal protein L19